MVVDSDYRGEIKVAFHNDTDIVQLIPAGSRIAQLVIIPYKREKYEETNELNETERGENGFGSTGIK